MADGAMTRRALLGAGAAGTGAAALLGLPLDRALAQGGGSTIGAPGAAGERAGRLATAPSQLPGTVRRPLGFGAFRAIGIDAVGASVVYSAATAGVYASNGILVAPIDLPAGAQVVRVDVFANRTTTGTMTCTLAAAVPGTSTNVAIAGITTASGTGDLTGAYTPTTPLVVGAGEQLYLEVEQSSPTATMCGAEVHYLDTPALRLLAAPIRVYDSRAGFSPPGVVKGRLTGGATRTIDCTVGSAVPPGATAALVTATVTNTSPAGFVSLFAEGLAWPGTSSLNWDHVGASIATTTLTALDAAGRCAAYVSSGSSTDLVVDVIAVLG